MESSHGIEIQVEPCEEEIIYNSKVPNKSAFGHPDRQPKEWVGIFIRIDGVLIQRANRVPYPGDEISLIRCSVIGARM